MLRKVSLPEEQSFIQGKLWRGEGGERRRCIANKYIIMIEISSAEYAFHVFNVRSNSIKRDKLYSSTVKNKYTHLPKKRTFSRLDRDSSIDP